eukprot:TRINITY_DN14806_c0_g1_i1.p1 TRINITY_DN14806_c0_g1~~TRINITY_DN14806_c0_g1_i1.p1  ORF type:complete len:124 (-),score=29.63 TRINITY_DN14806_c0_g1_i1:140-478(-)
MATPGKLKLKGAPLAVVGGIKKQPAKPMSVTSTVPAQAAAKAITPAAAQIILPEDSRTAAELAYAASQAKREKERIKKAAKTSHREKIAEFNKHLASLTEHNDIPKVDPRNQ